MLLFVDDKSSIYSHAIDEMISKMIKDGTLQPAGQGATLKIVLNLMVEY